MIVGIYAMRDELTGFLTPTFEQNDKVAMRNFEYALTRKDTLLFASAKDFDLFKIGTFDSDNAKITEINPPTLLLQGVSINRGNENEV